MNSRPDPGSVPGVGVRTTSRNGARRLLALVLVLVLAAALTRGCYRWPELVPAPVQRLAQAIIGRLAAPGAESAADVEWWLVFGVSLMLASLAVAAGHRLLLRRPAPPSAAAALHPPKNRPIE